MRWQRCALQKRRDAAVSFIGQVLKWAFVGAMCIFTLYPVIYTLLGSFKTNAELTLGGGILPEKWQIENYIYAFQKLEFGKYTLNSVVLAPLDRVVHSYDRFDGCIYHCPQRVPGKKLLTTSYLLSMFISVGSVALYPLYGLLHAVGLTSNMVGLALLLTGGRRGEYLHGFRLCAQCSQGTG